MPCRVFTGRSGEDLAAKVDKYLEDNEDQVIDTQALCSDGHQIYLSVVFAAKPKNTKKKVGNDNTRRSK